MLKHRFQKTAGLFMPKDYELLSNDGWVKHCPY